MKKTLPIILWVLVVVLGGFVILLNWNKPNPALIVQTTTNGQSEGTVIVDVPWKHLQHVPDFELTNQDGKPFRYSDIAGRPMAVSFFFAGCPSICRDLNAQIRRMRDQLKNSISSR